MSGLRRIKKDICDIKTGGFPSLQDLHIDESNYYNWEGLITPVNAPYSKGAFKINVLFPQEYPFKPPKITFKTKIYHPNIDEEGEICLGIINSENWKPATKITQVFQDLVNLIDNPEISHSLRPELAEEYNTDKRKFFRVAEEFTKKHAEKRHRD